MSSQFFFFFFFFPFHFLLLVRLKWQHWEHFLVGFPGADTHQPRKLFCWEGSACKTKQDAHAYALGPASAHIRWQSTHSPGVGMSRLTAAVTCSASVPSVSSLHKHTSIGEHTHTHTHTQAYLHTDISHGCVLTGLQSRSKFIFHGKVGAKYRFNLRKWAHYQREQQPHWPSG